MTPPFDRLDDALPDRARERVGRVRDRLVSPWANRSYLFKMGLGTALQVVLVIGIGLLIFTQTSAVLADDTRASFTRTSDLQAETTSTWISSMDRQATLMQQSHVVQTGSPDEIQTHFTEQMRQLPSEVVTLYYVDFSTDDPTIVTSTVTGREGSSASELGAPWADMSPPSAGEEAAMSAIYEPNIAPINVVAFVAPTDSSEAVVMVVDLVDASNKLSAPESGQGFVVDGDGTILLSTETGDIGANAYESGYISDADRSEVDDGTVSEAQHVTDVTVDGETYLTAISAVPGSRGADLVAVSQAPNSEAFALRNQIVTLLVALILGVLVAGVFVSGGLGYSTVSNLRELSKRAERISDGEFDVSLATDRRDEIGQAYVSVDRMRNSLQENIDEAQQAAEQAERAREEQQQLTDELTTYVGTFRDRIGDAADGDLTVRVDADSDVDQLNAMAEELNEMLESLERSVAEAIQFSQQVASESHQTTTAIEDMRETSDDIATAMQDINDGASEQDRQLDDTVTEMNELSSATEEIAASLNNVAQVAEDTAETGQSGIGKAEGALDDMEQVDEESQKAVDAMEQLQDRIEEIEEIAEFIADVAEQTNILALNANIEAARAGEAGEGFAVVAEEVKTLAEETRQATDEIEQLVEDVRDETGNTAEVVQDTREIVREATVTFEETVDAFEQIAEYADQTNQGIQDIDQTVQSQAKSVEEVVTQVEQVATISERTAGEAENVAAAAEEQTATIEQINTSTSDLSRRAERLDSLLEAFTVESEPAEPTPDATADD